MKNNEVEIQAIDKKENAEPIKEEGQLALDIYEKKDEFVIIAPIAGLSREEIELLINNEVLVIKGERKYPEQVKEKDFLVKECFFGPFSRAIILPNEANQKEINAKFDKNILEIRIKKEKQTGPTHIEIN
jgi:HSP20 family protein